MAPSWQALLRRRIYPKITDCVPADAKGASRGFSYCNCNASGLFTMAYTGSCFRVRLPLVALPLWAAVAVVVVPDPAAAQSNAAPIPLPFDHLFSKPSQNEPIEGLSADLMYRLLVADIALQRGEPALAARAYFESARETHNATL